MSPYNARRPRDLRILPRAVDYDCSRGIERGRYWHGSGPVTTHFINALQASFPEGERFFIESAADGVKRLKRRDTLESQLEADWRDFVLQEGLHSRQHARWNKALAAAGYRRIEAFDTLMRDRRHWFRKNLSVATRLGMSAGAEHYTAALARILVFGDPSLLTRMSSPFGDLMLYHAMEEVEHKGVCYDLFKALGSGYVRRLLSFAFITWEIWFNVHLRTRALLSADGLWDRAHRTELRRFYLGKKGIFRLLAPRVLLYMKPNFHPWQSDERGALERSFGRLRQQFRVPPFERG